MVWNSQNSKDANSPQTDLQLQCYYDKNSSGRIFKIDRQADCKIYMGS